MYTVISYCAVIYCILEIMEVAMSIILLEIMEVAMHFLSKKYSAETILQ